MLDLGRVTVSQQANYVGNCLALDALTLLVGHQEEHLACKK